MSNWFIAYVIGGAIISHSFTRWLARQPADDFNRTKVYLCIAWCGLMLWPIMVSVSLPIAIYQNWKERR